MASGKLFPRDKKPPILRRIKWKFEPIYWGIRNFPSNLVKLLQWIPIIWRDRDWDYIFLLKIMRFKMKRMHEHFEKYGQLVVTSQMVHQLQFCEKKIDEILEDNFIKAEMDAHTEKWGELNTDWYDTETPGLSRLDLYRPGAREKGLEDQEREESQELYHLEETRREKAVELLFAVMRRNLRRWWD